MLVENYGFRAVRITHAHVQARETILKMSQSVLIKFESWSGISNLISISTTTSAMRRKSALFPRSLTNYEQLYSR